MKKYFLAQTIFECDAVADPSLSSDDIRIEVARRFQNDPTITTRRMDVFQLARMPNESGDLYVEELEYRGFELQVFQNDDTVGSDVHTYYSTARNLGSKSNMVPLVSHDCESIDEAISEAKVYVDKRRARKDFKGLDEA